jgi:hypothetical protein
VSQVASYTASKIATGSKIFGGFIVEKAKNAGEVLKQNEKI